MAKTKVQLEIGGMTCQGCVRSIEKKLGSVPGVDYAHVNLGAGKADVEFDDTRASVPDLLTAVSQIGFTAQQI